MAKAQIRGNTQILAATITNAEINAAAAIASTKLATWSADRNAGSNKLTSLANGSAASDAVNKGQLDAAVAAIATGSGKTVRLTTTGNVTLSGTQTIDTVAGAANDRIFVRAQTAPAENGIYDMKSGAWTRSADADTWAELPGSFISVEEGSANYADTLWLITADLGGTLGTTAVTSIQLPGPSDLLAGAGLTRTGQTIDVIAGDNSITANANDIIVKRDGAGSISLSGSGIAVALTANKGLEIVSNALGIKLNGASLTLGASGLSVTNPSPTFVTRETPSGTVNGSNVTFTLANTPTAGSEEVFKMGQLQEPGSGNDYTISGAVITYDVAPVTGDQIRVNYRY